MHSPLELVQLRVAEQQGTRQVRGQLPILQVLHLVQPEQQHHFHLVQASLLLSLESQRLIVYGLRSVHTHLGVGIPVVRVTGPTCCDNTIDPKEEIAN